MASVHQIYAQIVQDGSSLSWVHAVNALQGRQHLTREHVAVKFRRAVVGIKNGTAQDVCLKLSLVNQIKYSTVPRGSARVVLNIRAQLMATVKHQSAEQDKLLPLMEHATLALVAKFPQLIDNSVKIK
jgi:hypothetical protein